MEKIAGRSLKKSELLEFTHQLLQIGISQRLIEEAPSISSLEAHRLLLVAEREGVDVIVSGLLARLGLITEASALVRRGRRADQQAELVAFVSRLKDELTEPLFCVPGRLLLLPHSDSALAGSTFLRLLAKPDSWCSVNECVTRLISPSIQSLVEVLPCPQALTDILPREPGLHAPSPEMEAAFLIEHGLRTGFCPLDWLLELRLTLLGAEPQRLKTRLESVGLGRALEYCQYLFQRILNCDFPGRPSGESVLTIIERTALTEWICHRGLRTGRLWLGLIATPRWSDRLRLLISAIRAKGLSFVQDGLSLLYSSIVLIRASSATTKPIQVSFYRRVCIFGVIIKLESNDEQLLEEVWAHLLPPSLSCCDEICLDPETSTGPEVIWQILGPGPQTSHFCLLENGVIVSRPKSKTALLHRVHGAFHLLVAQSSHEYLFIHAGVVGYRGLAIIIPGRSFAGKSTLVEALMRQGADYLSDEYAVVDQDGLIRPYPLRRGIRQGIRAFHGRQAVTGSKLDSVGLPVAMIVAATYVQGNETSLARISAGKACLVLLENTVASQARPVEAMQRIAKITELAPCFFGPRGDAEETATWILGQLR